MRIRNAIRDDIRSLATAYVTAFAATDPSERWTEERAAALISFFLNAQPDLAFVAESDGQIVGGICGLAKPWWDGDHLVETEIFLLPGAQRCGIGTALFSHFLSEARSKYGASIMESITFKDLPFPSSWYKSLGFEDKTDWKVIHAQTAILAQRLRG